MVRRDETVVKRDDLYEQVWSKPMTKLAEEYGISDVGLAKACKRMEIPRPPRGYWQQLKVGKAPPKAELKALSDEGVDQVSIRPTPSPRFPSASASDVENVPVPESLNSPHVLIQKSLAALEKGKPDERGFVVPRNKTCLDIRVTRANLDRACRIMDALVKELETRDYGVKISGERPARTVVTVDGEEIEIGIDEKVHQVEHEPTPEEKRKYARSLWQIPRVDYLPTGSLILKIRNAIWLGIRQQWADGKVQRVGGCLGSFVNGLQNAAHAAKERRKEQKRREREWAEAERRREEARRLARLEEKKTEKLTKDVSGWRMAKRIREYLAELEGLHGEVEGLPEWVEWARQYADKIDPLKHPGGLVFSAEKYDLF